MPEVVRQGPPAPQPGSSAATRARPRSRRSRASARRRPVSASIRASRYMTVLRWQYRADAACEGEPSASRTARRVASSVRALGRGQVEQVAQGGAAQPGHEVRRLAEQGLGQALVEPGDGAGAERERPGREPRPPVGDVELAEPAHHRGHAHRALGAPAQRGDHRRDRRRRVLRRHDHAHDLGGAGVPDRGRDAGEGLGRRGQRVVVGLADGRDDAEDLGVLGHVEHPGGVPGRAGLAAAPGEQALEHRPAPAQLEAAQPRLLAPVGVDETVGARVEDAPHVVGDDQQRRVVRPGEPLLRHRPHPLPDQPPALAVGAQHDLERHALARPAPPGVDGEGGRVDVDGQVTGELGEQPLEARPARRAQVVAHRDAEHPVDVLPLEDPPGEPVGEAVDVLQQRAAQHGERVPGGVRADGSGHRGSMPRARAVRSTSHRCAPRPGPAATGPIGRRRPPGPLPRSDAGPIIRAWPSSSASCPGSSTGSSSATSPSSSRCWSRCPSPGWRCWSGASGTSPAGRSTPARSWSSSSSRSSRSWSRTTCSSAGCSRWATPGCWPSCSRASPSGARSSWTTRRRPSTPSPPAPTASARSPRR